MATSSITKQFVAKDSNAFERLMKEIAQQTSLYNRSWDKEDLRDGFVPLPNLAELEEDYEE